ncbi:hypothetical protein CQW23_03173 [Capsicum baccatum]|uniref:CBM-cenC domain-containing protein n=1 Tax=Capsicum baccatum TaxID=33114 RepID=A0A2G2XB29_CAPBA|nr:hypothetical protein CQW23_03173 [Capsicum baccatum]
MLLGLFENVSGAQDIDKDWVKFQGKILLNDTPSQDVVYLEGPPAGIDILHYNLVIKHEAKPLPPSPPVIEETGFGVNIIANTNLNDGTNGWFSLENCTMSAQKGLPHIMPPMARHSFAAHEPLSGCHILVTYRTQKWMGPTQMITDKIKLYLTYQVFAWVKIGQASGPQNVNVALGVDSQWVNGGQGPAAGVDLMVVGLQIFSIDRSARFRHLKRCFISEIVPVS